MTPLETYLRELRDIRSSGAAVKETSYYPALSNLFNEVGKRLKPRVRCIINLANRGAGLPDGGLFTAEQFQKPSEAEPLPGQPPARGVIEVKSTKDDAWITADGKQVSGYWGQYRQVLVTNYRDFVLVGQDAEGKFAKLESFRLADSEKAFWAAAVHPRSLAEKIGARFEEYLLRVMRHAAQLAAPEDVAWFLASYARDARARIEGVELAALATVRTALEEALGLKFEGEKGEHFFRSSLVQTLFYGVFSAWVLWAKQNPPASKARFDWYTTARYLRVPMISKLFHLVADPQELEALKLTEVLEWAALVLNRVDRRSFFDKFQESHAVQYFYEPFLEAFDPELRKELGVWYTPPEIVKYMVERVDTVLREELNLPDGLANKNVYVLDPCCGTGSYLVEVLDRIHRTLKERGEDALTASDLKEAAQRRVFGFEIMPAPFVVSHLQLGLFLQNVGAPLSERPRERVGVYLTNALTGWEPPKGPKQRLIFPELEEERDAAEHVKLDVPILVILGNPPYNSFAGIASMDEERNLSEAYRTTRQAPAPQGQGLNDLYVRFFRMAERRIVEKTGKGVVCLISNYSWLDGLSFTGMRERYLEAFDHIWIDCLNGDKYKTGKLTPEGEPDPSIFSTETNREGIQVGTAIALLVRNAGFQPAPGQSRQDAGVTDRSAGFPPAPEQSRQDAGVTVVPFRYESVAFRGRGYLPHWEMEGATYSVTIRLGDSLPQALLSQLEFERKDIVKTAQQLGRDLSDAEKTRLADVDRRFDEALDAGYGACRLARPEVAEMVSKALQYFEGERYELVAACVMPNHVHAVFAPLHGHGLADILHSWKSFTSKEANKLLGATGQFWEREYFDRLIRNADELERTVRYVVENPTKAGLKGWKWVWIRDAFRNAGFQPAPEQSRQDAGATKSPVVRFRHFWGKTKRQQLLESAAQDEKALYDELTPPLDLGLPFAPAQVATGYLQWPLLPERIESSSPGVNTSRDLDLVEIDLPKLTDRISAYFDKSVSDHDLKAVVPSLMTASARYDPLATRRHLLERGLASGSFVRYCYRPFDTRHVYWHPETKLIDEKREDLFSTFKAGNLFLTSRQKAERQNEGTPFYVTRHLSDRHLTRPGCNCFPLTTAGLPSHEQHELGKSAKSEGGITANLSIATRAYLANLGIVNPDAGANTLGVIWMHALAIGYSPAYLSENADGIRQDWPRIPMPDSKEALLTSAARGRQIAALLDTETAVGAVREPPLQRIATFTLPHGTTLDEARHFAVTAGWGHAGKGGITMPGKGKIIERDYTLEERVAAGLPRHPKNGDVKSPLLGDRTCDVYLNEVAYWSNIPLRVWEYTIGGYQVMKKWLSYREEKLLGRPLTKEEVRYVQEMARRIAALLLLEPALDANYHNVKEHTFSWKG